MPSKKRKEVESSVRRNTRSKAAKAFADSEIDSSTKISTDAGATVFVIMESSVDKDNDPKSKSMPKSKAKSNVKPSAKDVKENDSKGKAIAKSKAQSNAISKAKSKEAEEDDSLASGSAKPIAESKAASKATSKAGKPIAESKANSKATSKAGKPIAESKTTSKATSKAGKPIAESKATSKANSKAEESEKDESNSSSSDEGSSSSDEGSSSSDGDMEVFPVISKGFGVDQFNNFFLEAVRTFESTALFNNSHQTNATWLKYACAAALASCVIPGIIYMKSIGSCTWTSLNTAVKQLLSYTGLDKASMKILKALCKEKVILKNRDNLLTVALKYEGLIVRNFKTNIEKYLANSSLKMWLRFLKKYDLLPYPEDERWESLDA